jgi:ABC-type glycerol-3-phosphate transport system permease component
MVGIFLTAILTFLFAWWNYSSDLILLKHYGYDIEGMNETEFYGKVLPENMEKVKSIETSIMGIGWPLKAIMTFIFYLPYLIIIYIIYYLIEKNRRKKITYTSEI